MPHQSPVTWLSLLSILHLAQNVAEHLAELDRSGGAATTSPHL
ncbi:Uncharacterised protein [Vibrio cholerae]|uniref:Uncharacterized protein n=1 Tax=Vibrio cholerae TaxID=666 RepID=A0A655R189_VIBCL|nr:Uncharacterised protein [Vibrio cholerae]CSA80113.1 Uncharacterised protein [Vibrio cholerae]CSB52187.1 Uncharacterised protein [Vibrio cholerae]